MSLGWELCLVLRSPSGFAVGVFGREPQDICGEHTAENLLLHDVTLEHLCSLLPGLGKCGYGLLGHV